MAVTIDKTAICLTLRAAVLSALGMIASSRTNRMSVAFTQMEEKQQAVLGKWLADLRDSHERVSAKRPFGVRLRLILGNSTCCISLPLARA